jgi:large subunit ribosomal protein L1
MASKRYEQGAKLVDLKRAYPLAEAVALLKQMPAAKFDETVELSASLNIDPKNTEQVVRGTLTLPHGTGRARKVLVFCRGEQELQAKAAQADHVGGAELIEKIQGGWLDFDVVIATPDMMREVSKLGKLLGPRGLMPSPKAGTITQDVAAAVEDIRRGKVEFKMDKQANIHLVIGKRSFEPRQIIENAQTALEALVRAKPSGVKGRLLRRVSLSSTMSPGIVVSADGLEG